MSIYYGYYKVAGDGTTELSTVTDTYQTGFSTSDERIPSSNLVYQNLINISSMIQTQLTRLNGIV